MAYENIIAQLNDIKGMVIPYISKIKGIVNDIQINIDNDASLLGNETNSNSISSLLDEIIRSYEIRLNESMNSIGIFGTEDPLLLIDSLAHLRSLREYIKTKKVVSDYLKKRNGQNNVINTQSIPKGTVNNRTFNNRGFNNAKKTFGPTRSRSSSPTHGGKRRPRKNTRRRNSRG
jgi:hypothetical protein